MQFPGPLNYTIEKDISTGLPKLYPLELTYLWQEGVTWTEKRGEFQKGTIMVTTHRIIWYNPNDSLRPILGVPLFYIYNLRPSGGLFSSDKIAVDLTNLAEHPKYYLHYCKTVLGIVNPQVANYPAEFTLIFNSGGKDKVLAKLKEAINGRHWDELPEKPPEKGIKGIGISAIQKETQGKANERAAVLATSFVDLDSLKESAKKLVTIAEKIKTKMVQNDASMVSKEMQEVQAVMFDIGIGTPITKEAAGKEYYTQLAIQVGKFVKELLDKCGGITTGIDAYCLYNRARGTDLISPQDFLIAAKMLGSAGFKIKAKELDSKTWIFESESFNEKLQADNVIQLLKEKGALSPEQIANFLNVSLMIMKEKLLKIEKEGMICRDDSMEGLQYCLNLFKEYFAAKMQS